MTASIPRDTLASVTTGNIVKASLAMLGNWHMTPDQLRFDDTKPGYKWVMPAFAAQWGSA